MAQRFSKPFYNSKEWKKIRDYIIKRDKYLCVMCGNVAEEVHHNIHLNPGNINNQMISMHESNLISLCKDCHFKQHAQKKSDEISEGYIFDDDGYIIEINNCTS